MTYFKPPSATLILRKNTFKKHLQKYCFYHRNGMQKITDHCAFSLYIGSLAEILGRQKALLSIAKFNNNRKVAQKYIMSTFALCSLMGCVNALSIGRRFESRLWRTIQNIIFSRQPRDLNVVVLRRADYMLLQKFKLSFIYFQTFNSQNYS